MPETTIRRVESTPCHAAAEARLPVAPRNYALGIKSTVILVSAIKFVFVWTGSVGMGCSLQCTASKSTGDAARLV